MVTDQYHSFSLLKKEVEVQAAKKLGIHKALTDWSLQDIRDFQADLEAECKSSLSEKWVYTHFKNNENKLPRVDVLNLLSSWLGYKNWDEFLRRQNPGKSKRKKGLLRNTAVVIGIAITAFFTWLLYFQRMDIVIVFKDVYTRAPIPYEEITLKIGNQLMYAGNVSNQFIGDTIIADGPYYKQKKVALSANLDDTLVVELLPDDYALMLNFFSRSTGVDLDKRRDQLIEAIHPEAKIFQSHPQYEGIELLNRDEFIDRLTLPINSLKNLEIQHIVYREEKVYRLQFIQKIEEDEDY